MSDKPEVNAGIKCLIFDCDGTLVDSMPLHMNAWQTTFKTYNKTLDKDYLFSLNGMKEIDIIHLYNEKFQSGLNPEEMIKDKHLNFEKHIEKVQPIQKIASIAKKYYGRIPLAVVSGSLKKIVIKELQITGLYDLFDVILTGDDPFPPKPDPQIFLEVARQLNVKPEQCQVFEDGDPGLEAARKAGMVATDVRLFL